MSASILITPPAAEPLTLAEAKAHLRLETTADDALVASLITAARQWVERVTGRALIHQTWQLWLDAPPGSEDSSSSVAVVELPRAPLVSVSAISSYDETDAATTWDSAQYVVDAAREPGRVAPRNGFFWPVPARALRGLRIEYVAGFGATASSVPEPLRLALRQLVTHWYENRGDAAGSDAPPSIPTIVTALVNPWRLRRVRL